MATEIWKDIPGYEGQYQASDQGRIRSVDRIENTARGPWHYKGKILRPGVYCKSGHVSVVLGHGRNGSPVHQLVMATFIGPRAKDADVRHLNGNPKDNRLSNLAYGSRTENIIDVYRQGKRWRRLNLKEVYQIKESLSQGVKGSVLAKQYGVTATTISAIKTGTTYAWVGEA